MTALPFFFLVFNTIHIIAGSSSSQKHDTAFLFVFLTKNALEQDC